MNIIPKVVYNILLFHLVTLESSPSDKNKLITQTIKNITAINIKIFLIIFAILKNIEETELGSPDKFDSKKYHLNFWINVLTSFDLCSEESKEIPDLPLFNSPDISILSFHCAKIVVGTKKTKTNSKNLTINFIKKIIINSIITTF